MTRPSSKDVLWIVVALTVVGLALRLVLVGDSLYGDELSTYYTVAGHGLGSTLANVRSDVELTPPLYYILTWLFARLGDTPEALRAVSMLAGVATIPLTYQLGARTVGVRAALFAAALTALSPLLIFYSTEARAYSLMMVLALLTTLALLRALDGHRSGWIAYSACSALALYTHYTVAFVLAAVFVWALVRKPDARRALIIANGVAFIAFLPWWPEFRADTASVCAHIIAALEPFTATTAGREFAYWSFGTPLTGLAVIPGLTAALLLVLGLILAMAQRLAESRDRPAPSDGLWLVLALAVGAPIGAALYSALATNVFIARNLIASWPGLALLIGALVMRGGRARALIAPALVLAAFVIVALATLSPKNRRPDYAAAAAFIDRSAAADDAVLEASFPTPGPLTALYVAEAVRARNGGPRRTPILVGSRSIADQVKAVRAGAAPCVAMSITGSNSAAVARQVRALGGRQMFLVTWTPGARAPSITGLERELEGQYRRTGTRTFPGLGSDSALSVFEFTRR